MSEAIVHTSITAMSQRSFASTEYALKKKRTRRELFLADMERVVPLTKSWACLHRIKRRAGARNANAIHCRA